MADPMPALLLDFLAWTASRPRSYAEVMEAWRTSCPRFPVWEDAVDRGLVERGAGPVADVALTAAGRALLASERGKTMPNGVSG